LGHRALEPEGQDQVLLPPQGQLEGLHRVELLVGGQTEIDAGDPVQSLGEVLDDGAGREGPERSIAGSAVSRPSGAGPRGARRRACTSSAPPLSVVYRLSQATGVGWRSLSPARMCPRSTRTPPGARDEQGRQRPRTWRSRRGRVSERAARASAQLFQDLLDVERCQRDFDPAVLGTPLQGVIAGDRLEGPIADGRKILAVDAGSLQE